MCDEFIEKIKTFHTVDAAGQIQALSTENKLHKIHAPIFDDR